MAVETHAQVEAVARAAAAAAPALARADPAALDAVLGAMAGALRAEATLALANALFVGFLLFGGIVVPVASLPGPIADIAQVLPAAALADAFRIALGWSAQDPAGPTVVLVVWAVVATVLTVRTFRWE